MTGETHSTQSNFADFSYAVKRGFGSDNHAGTHPRLLAAISRVNDGHLPAYGIDPISEKAYAVFKDHFGPEAETFFVFTGTAANVLALSTCVRPHHAVLASQHAHILNDECAAPEKNLGCKLISIPSHDAKLTPEMIKPYLIRRGDQHAAQVKVISITQPTELGTVYTIEEIRRLSEFARAERLMLHMDGARLSNAVASLGCTFREITTDVGVDVLSFGGSKNGLMFGEAVVFLRPGLSGDFRFSRKQAMQLPSKTRFIAAQFAEYLGTNLWRECSSHANQMAKLLAERLSQIECAKITQKVQANAVFVELPKKVISALRDEVFFYVWNEHTFECRLMTAWDTTVDEIERFGSALERLASLR